MVNVGVNHLALFLSGAHDDVPGFIGLAEIAFIAFGQSTDDIHQISADIKPLAGFRINNALERLVGEFNGQLIFVVFTSFNAGNNGAVFTLRIDVNEGAQCGHPLADHQFEHRAEAGVEIFHRGFSLETIQSVPLLLQSAGATHFHDFRAQREGAVGVGVRIDPTAIGFNHRLQHGTDSIRNYGHCSSLYCSSDKHT